MMSVRYRRRRPTVVAAATTATAAAAGDKTAPYETIMTPPLADDPKCNSEPLRTIIKEAIFDSQNFYSTRAWLADARRENDGAQAQPPKSSRKSARPPIQRRRALVDCGLCNDRLFQVICGEGKFSYVTTTEEFCQDKIADHTCYVWARNTDEDDEEPAAVGMMVDDDDDEFDFSKIELS